MRIHSLAAAVAALLVSAAPAYAGDPTMPLDQVQSGMQCTGYTVVRGTDISPFAVQVIDVVDGSPDLSGPRILVSVSGPAVDKTGVAEGFSGSPIYCPGADGVPRVIGAISESTGEYGGATAFATPIDQVLATPTDPLVERTGSGAKKAKAGASGRGAGAKATALDGRRHAGTSRGAKAAALDESRRAGTAAGALGTARATWARSLLAHARPLDGPLTISGVSGTVARALTAAAAKSGRQVLSVPAGPLGSFPPQTLRPGSSVATAYSTGDLRFGAVGTVTYTDGDKVWAFGHPLDDVGARALLLQDAYVYTVVNNPINSGSLVSFKLAGFGHDLGTLTDDGTNAVAGKVGPLPHTVPVTVTARDEDTHKSSTIATRVADEAAVDLPAGGSWTSSVAPLAVVQAATNVLGSTPGRVTGTMCARITLAQRKTPLRFCDRYVSTAQTQADDGSLGNAVTTGAASDLASALADVDAYTGRPPTVTGVAVNLKLHGRADQVYLRHVSAPASVHPGQRIRVTATLQALRGGTFKRRYTLRVPSGLRSGPLTLRLLGRDADAGDDSLATTIVIGDDSPSAATGDPGPTSLAQLAADVAALSRYEGVTLRMSDKSAPAFRDPDFRISGRAELRLRVTKRR